MSNDAQGVAILSETECWDLLSGVPLGRLVTTVDGAAHVFPVNFVAQNRTVLFRTAEGTKLVSTAINHDVVFEADGHDETQGWSVIVRGYAQILRTEEEIAIAEQAGLQSWTAQEKDHFVRIRPSRVTGRRFHFNQTETSVR